MTLTSIAEEFRSIVGNEWFLDTPEDLATYPTIIQQGLSLKKRHQYPPSI